jgi:preprotein translocase subunit SecE
MEKIITFFSEVRKEASKVTWPTRKETIVTSVLVVVLTGVAGVFFLAVDSVLAVITRWLINVSI